MPAQVASRHQQSLADDLLSTKSVRPKSKKRKARTVDGEEGGDGYVDSKASRKILKIGQELVEEAQNEAKSRQPANVAFNFEPRSVELGEQEEEDDEDEQGNYDDEESWGDEEQDAVEQIALHSKDLDLFNRFMPVSNGVSGLDLDGKEPPKRGESRNLADMILAQIEAREEGQGNQAVQGGGLPEDAVEIPSKVVDVYSKVGMILSRYKSGKLPKPFKIIPTLPFWQELVSITRPEEWTPNACYEATRIFVSCKPHIVREFIEIVLLERVRAEIHETTKLNVHLFKALQRTCYKPAGFFKGFLFPLVESGTCTLREAHIIASVITRASIPPLHASAALMRLTDIAAEQASQSSEGGGATNIFIRAFLVKKYALPYKVIDNLVFHFLRFRATDPTREDPTSDTQGSEAGAHRLPVLWHQSLLAFAERYRNDITEDQREALLDLLLMRGHKNIGPEVRRELLAGRGRGVVVPEVQHRDGGDDTMVLG